MDSHEADMAAKVRLEASVVVHSTSNAKVLEAVDDTIGMLRTIFDIFILFCIAWGFMFVVVFHKMFAHYIGLLFS